MASKSTDIWAWVHKDLEDFKEKEDPRYSALIDNYITFVDIMDQDPVGAELAITEALQAAQSLQEIRWQLHLRHWRLQLWSRQDQVKRMLPEAIDLLTLSTDERVKDVPQRICAYHDVVDCYVSMDPAGYHQDIVENSQHILAQLPKRHDCASCARSHIAHAEAAVGHRQEADYWLRQTVANSASPIHLELAHSFAIICSLAGNWQEARRYYEETRQKAIEQENSLYYTRATLGLARIHLMHQEIDQAYGLLQDARRHIRFTRGTSLLALLQEVEGVFSQTVQRPAEAIDYLTRAGRLYYELGLYRDAAQAALQAAELGQEQQLPTVEARELAAKAVGMTPPASKDLYSRLSTLGEQPVTPTAEQESSQQIGTAEEEDQKELTGLQSLLQEQSAKKLVYDLLITLYQLGGWHSRHQEYRAALDYILLYAIIERIMRLSSAERHRGLEFLTALKEELPTESFTAALHVLEEGPPTWIAPLFGNIDLAQWRWTVQTIATELTGAPPVEPEPVGEESDATFQLWLNNIISMTILILRFREKADPEGCERWARSLEGTLQQVKQGLETIGKTEDPITQFLESLIALTRGTSIEETIQTGAPEWRGTLEQMAMVAQQPVWFHPDSSPIDYLVEQAAQKAVDRLRIHDEVRKDRLANLAFRYELMTIDLEEVEELHAIAHFLHALSALLLADGAKMPELQQPLEPPFDSFLQAVYDAQ